jgi:hypothetical protein
MSALYGAAQWRPVPASITGICRKKTNKYEENAFIVTGKVVELG